MADTSSTSRPPSMKAPPQPSRRRDEPPPGRSYSPRLGPPTAAPLLLQTTARHADSANTLERPSSVGTPPPHPHPNGDRHRGGPM
eukprot:9128641-Pyramimonas_sp.AAC.1